MPNPQNIERVINPWIARGIAAGLTGLIVWVAAKLNIATSTEQTAWVGGCAATVASFVSGLVANGIDWAYHKLGGK